MSLSCAIFFCKAYTVFHCSTTTGSPGADGSLNEGTKRSKHSFQSKTFKVEISFTAKIPLQSIALALEGVESDSDAQDALRVLNIILRQRAASMYFF